MMPKAEAQRVIAISLGKIASYRNQRGGSSLHKNLLVANVLQKVRNYVVEDTNGMVVCGEHDTIYSEVSEVPQEVFCASSSDNLQQVEEYWEVKPNNEPVGLLHNLEAREESGSVTGATASRDTVNSDVTDSTMVDCLDDTNGNSTIPNSSEELDFFTTCDEMKTKTGLKRRLLYGLEDCVRVKRRKCDVHTDDISSWRCTSDCDSDIEGDLDVEQELQSPSTQGESPMDTEQICNLVTVFRCSFQGLGLIEKSSDAQGNSSSSSSGHTFLATTCDLTTSGHREAKPSLRRGLSLPDLCAKQADLLGRPTFERSAQVALTV